MKQTNKNLAMKKNDPPVRITTISNFQENPSLLKINNFIINKSIGVPLKNEIGEQNCFLNVIIHMLFQVNEIKNFLFNEEIDSNKGLLIALKQTFENYYSYTKSKQLFVNFKLDPSYLRIELAELFKKENKFQIKQTADPVEALFAIINSFHSFTLVIIEFLFRVKQI